MPVNSLENTIELKVKQATDKVQEKYFRQFINSKTSEERELLHTKTVVVKDIAATLINTLRENK